MLEKIADSAEAYCTYMLSLMCGFIERTHGVIAIGLPLSFLIAVKTFLPFWANAAIWGLFMIPAAVGMIMLLIVGLSQSARQ